MTTTKNVRNDSCNVCAKGSLGSDKHETLLSAWREEKGKRCWATDKGAIYRHFEGFRPTASPTAFLLTRFVYFTRARTTGHPIMTLIPRWQIPRRKRKYKWIFHRENSIPSVITLYVDTDIVQGGLSDTTLNYRLSRVPIVWPSKNSDILPILSAKKTGREFRSRIFVLFKIYIADIVLITLSNNCDLPNVWLIYGFRCSFVDYNPARWCAFPRFWRKFNFSVNSASYTNVIDLLWKATPFA